MAGMQATSTSTHIHSDIDGRFYSKMEIVNSTHSLPQLWTEMSCCVSIGHFCCRLVKYTEKIYSSFIKGGNSITGEATKDAAGSPRTL